MESLSCLGKNGGEFLGKLVVIIIQGDIDENLRETRSICRYFVATQTAFSLQRKRSHLAIGLRNEAQRNVGTPDLDGGSEGRGFDK